VATERSISAGVAIVGAGPYGLSTAAHLRGRGVGFHMFGEDMEFWEKQMPVGMFLRSAWDATSIADPTGALSIDAYEETLGRSIGRPVPLDDFVRYGRWFREQVAPDLDRRRVESIERDGPGFRLELSDGSAAFARRVVVATGLDSCARRPPQLDHLSGELAPHSCELRELERFRGQRVAVIGGGQSAIELAALLSEAGAEVEVIARATGIHFLRRQWVQEHLGPLERLLYPRTDVGPPGLNWVVAAPALFRLLPRRLRDPIAVRCIRPAAASWLPDRLHDVNITLGREVVSASVADGRLRLKLSDGGERGVDRVVAATGYRVDLDRNRVLSTALRGELARIGGAPKLGRGFQSSVPGLYFVGAAAAASFGPVSRFVSGTNYTGAAVACHIARAERRRRPARQRPAITAAPERAG
jgi:cation diffusion facilitator CzcD-associated flavoprotein CzcO